MAKQKRKRRKGKGPRKGSAYERKLCARLSHWWSNGASSDVFWRTAGSGSRATSRGKRGVATKNSHGDVAATDMDGLPLLDIAVMSLKNGYHKVHASALLDKPNKKVDNELAKWFREIEVVWDKCGSFSWMLIHRRLARAEVVYMPWLLFNELEKAVGRGRLGPSMELVDLVPNDDWSIMVMRLDIFLKRITPEVIKKLATKL